MKQGENTSVDLQRKWFTQGEKYAKAINEMVAFGKKHGWDQWKGEEAEDKRAPLIDAVIAQLKQANQANTIDAFRVDFPPAYEPMLPLLEEKSQYIGDIVTIDADTVAFLAGTSYEVRTPYLIKGTEVEVLDHTIKGMGKAMRGTVIALAYSDKIVTHQGWNGSVIAEFKLNEIAISKLIPFNDGKRVLVVSTQGVYLVEE